MSDAGKKVIFFILIGVLYGILQLLTKGIVCHSDNKAKGVLAMACIVIGLLSFVLAEAIGLFKHTRKSGEGYEGVGNNKKDLGGSGENLNIGFGDLLSISQGKECRGGLYLHSGDSPTSKMCRKLAESKGGMEQIQRYNCGTGYDNMPGGRFEYDVLSGNNWENDQCASKSGNCGYDNNSFY
jgi:hypothetical protein